MPLQNSLFTMTEVAKELGVTCGRVSQLCSFLRKKGTIIGSDLGKMKVFNLAEIELIKREMKPVGRPKNSAHAI